MTTPRREGMQVPYPGQEVVICGYRFVVKNPRTVASESFGAVVRFEGQALDESLKGTGYDGGTYGHVVGYRLY